MTVELLKILVYNGNDRLVARMLRLRTTGVI